MTDTNPSALTHFDTKGDAHMVDIGAKPLTARKAVAGGRIQMKQTTLDLIQNAQAAKGDVLGVARVAGIMAAKRTSDIVPLCHPLPLDAVEVSLAFPEPDCVVIEAVVRATARTGVEMEALTAVTAAALTIYDMVKAVERGMRIEGIHLIEKRGGKSGHYRAKASK